MKVVKVLFAAILICIGAVAFYLGLSTIAHAKEITPKDLDEAIIIGHGWCKPYYCFTLAHEGEKYVVALNHKKTCCSYSRS